MDTTSVLPIISDLIRAGATLLWPLIVLVLALVFRSDITAILARLRRGKFLGQELELEPTVEKLSKNVEIAKANPRDSKAMPLPESVKGAMDADEAGILEAAKPSPELGIIKLASVLEREMRTIVGSLGLLEGRKGMTALRLMDLMISKDLLPKGTGESIRIFQDLRNRIVHGRGKANEREVLRTLDIGLALLRRVKVIPHETNVVYLAGIDLYNDAECTSLVEGVKGIILESTSFGGIQTAKRIFPTTKRGYYRNGHHVTWEWSNVKGWYDDTWYVDPDSGQRKLAWNSSAEFMGRHFDDA